MTISAAFFASSMVLFLQNENLMEDLATFLESPMLRRILEGSIAPEEQADPMLAQTPFRSSINKSVSPSTPSK